MAQALRKPEETQSYTERIRDLLEQDRVGAARALLAEAVERKDHKEDLSLLQRVLAPAEILGLSHELDVDRTADFQWIETQSGPYRGQWVALLGGELLAHSASLDEVGSVLKQSKPPARALLHYIQHPPQVPGLAEARTYAEKIKAYVEADCVGAARALLAEATQTGEHGEDLSGWQEILAPARVIPPRS